MTDFVTHPFSTHLEFEAQVRECIARSQRTLQLFDPDGAVWPLGVSDVEAALRHFLAGGGHLQLAMHKSTHVEHNMPRFMHLLKDFGHAIECRVSAPNLRHLTDSFIIGDHHHVVRRFHSDHMRGEAVFDSPEASVLCLERFDAIWAESHPGLHATTLGL